MQPGFVQVYFSLFELRLQIVICSPKYCMAIGQSVTMNCRYSRHVFKKKSLKQTDQCFWDSSAQKTGHVNSILSSLNQLSTRKLTSFPYHYFWVSGIWFMGDNDRTFDKFYLYANFRVFSINWFHPNSSNHFVINNTNDRKIRFITVLV